MSKFFRVREAVPITIGETTHTFFVRELGYLEFEELRRKTLAEATKPGASDLDKERTGIALMHAVVLACVEEEDGKPSYSSMDEWRLELGEVLNTLGKAAMKAQGWDLDKLAAKKTDAADEPPTEEQIEGNDVPSRMSGESLPSSSAAPLANSSTG